MVAVIVSTTRQQRCSVLKLIFLQYCIQNTENANTQTHCMFSCALNKIVKPPSENGTYSVSHTNMGYLTLLQQLVHKDWQIIETCFTKHTVAAWHTPKLSPMDVFVEMLQVVLFWSFCGQVLTVLVLYIFILNFFLYWDAWWIPCWF
jgi:hypothetical protein